MGPPALIKLHDALAGVSRLALDTAPFSYFLKNDPARAPIVQAILELIDCGSLVGFGSLITLTELLVVPLKAGDLEIERLYRELLLDSKNFTLVPIDVSIAEHAASLRAQYNLKTPDAIVVATALQTGCQALLTNDLGLRRVTELSILVLDDLDL